MITTQHKSNSAGMTENQDSHSQNHVIILKNTLTLWHTTFYNTWRTYKN